MSANNGKPPELPQPPAERPKGYWFQVSVDRKRAPEGSDRRYDYDRVEVTLGGGGESYEETAKMVQAAVTLGATVGRRTIEQLQSKGSP